MNEEEIHLKLLAKSESAKDCGEMTVIKIGFVPAIIEEIVKHSQQQLLESLELEIEEKRKKLPKDPLDITPREAMQTMIQPVYRRYVSNEESFNNALNEVKALIQSKKNNL
jgi:hypothetical protein